MLMNYDSIVNSYFDDFLIDSDEKRANTILMLDRDIRKGLRPNMRWQWEKIDPKFKWIAINADGDVYAYTHMPVEKNGYWFLAENDKTVGTMLELPSLDHMPYFWRACLWEGQ